jgi:hypothetical protein
MQRLDEEKLKDSLGSTIPMRTQLSLTWWSTLARKMSIELCITLFCCWRAKDLSASVNEGRIRETMIYSIFSSLSRDHIVFPRAF